MKKIYSLLLLGGLLFFGAQSIMAAKTTQTIYFLNTENWTGTIKCHHWGGATTGTEWNGDPMTNVGCFSGYALYSLEIPIDREFCVFNNGSSQTGNISLSDVDGKMYVSGSWIDYDELETGMFLYIQTGGVGSFAEYEFVKADAGDSYFSTSVTISASDFEKVHKFYLQNKYGTTLYYHNNGTIACSVTNWSFNESNDCTLHPSKAGDYKFDLIWDGSTPKVSVTFPAGDNSYSISYTNPDTWSNVYVYGWTGDGNADFPTKKEPFGAWPGTKATEVSGIWTADFSLDSPASTIIWNNGAGSQKDAMTFVDQAIYNASGVITYSITPTPDGYATFYHPTYKASVPGGSVKAYTGTYNSSTNTLTLHELTGTYCNIIPSGTAVVLHSSNGATAFSVNINNGVNAGGIYGTNNLLGKSNITAVSSMAGEIGTGTLCVLGYDDDHAGFYQFVGDNLAANRAYLIVPGATTAPEIHFAYGDATDINAIDATEEVVKFFQDGKLFIKKNGVVYDMMGAVVK